MEKEFSSDEEKKVESLKLKEKIKLLTSSPSKCKSNFNAEKEDKNESVTSQIAIPFLCAGLGMVLAGLLLDHVKHWKAFRLYPELYILVPALLGLKGNLEMTLASRLSTLANLGQLKDWKMVKKVAKSNLALLQLQGILVGALASLIPMFFSHFFDASLSQNKTVLLMTSSIVTASLASLILGCIMIGVILVSIKFNINPDNVATPIAASLGDLVTLFLLANSSSIVLRCLSVKSYIPTMMLAFYAGIVPILYHLASAMPQTRQIALKGWTPVLAAMAISSMGGKILKLAIVKYPNMAAYQPVINGVAGNLVAVQASRIATSLHQHFKLGQLPHSLRPHNLINPSASFGCQDSYGHHARTARILLGLVVPGHLFFNLVIYLVQSKEDLSADYLFLGSYLISALVQVFILLHLANFLVHYLWQSGIDPDNASVPYLTALGDLLGGAFLAIVFVLNDK